MSPGPANIAALQAIKDPAERALAARDYIAARSAAIGQARTIRDASITELLKSHGPTEVARMCDVSVSTVKLIRGSKG